MVKPRLLCTKLFMESLKNSDTTVELGISHYFMFYKYEVQGL
jgi:hypothetical protein